MENIFNWNNEKGFYKYFFGGKIKTKAKRSLPDNNIERSAASRGKSYRHKTRMDLQM